MPVTRLKTPGGRSASATHSASAGGASIVDGRVYFGSGLSSFNYLKHFPVDGIKIDGLFVKGVAKNYLDYALVESIQRIGVSLGLQTIAEYVESEDIARKLTQIGVVLGQGFHLSPPRTWETLFEQKAAV